MKEAVRDLEDTLQDAASDTGLVTGLIDSIGKALAEVNSHFSYMHQQIPITTEFLRLFCRMRNRSLVSEREFTCLVDRSFLGS